MGGPRASSDRARLRGETCALCGRSTRPDPAWPGGERLCPLCEVAARHAAEARPYCVLLTFRGNSAGFDVRFHKVLHRGNPLPIGRYWRGLGQKDLHAMVLRASMASVPDETTATTLSEIDKAIQRTGSGSLYLNLTEAQFRRVSKR